MAMKSPPGSISPPAECRDQLQMGPRTRVRDDGASGSSFWKIMAASMFLGLLGIYRRRREPRWGPRSRGGPHPPAKGGPRQEAAPALWDSSRAALLTRSSSWRIKNLRKFPVQSENISRSNFLEQKHDKNRELALGIFSRG